MHNNNHNDTEKRILQCAEGEFLAKGYAGARTTTIAQAAGVTHAMFHYYFRTKDKLFERIMEEKIGMLKQLISDSVINDKERLGIEDIVRNIINHHLDFISQNPELPRFIITEMNRNQVFSDFIISNLKRFSLPILARLQKILDSGFENGELRKIQADTLMLDIVSLNIFSFMAKPLVNVILGGIMDDMAKFVEDRKKENFNTIMRKIKLN